MATCLTSLKAESGCGEFKGESNLVPRIQCNSDVTAHLGRCHLKKEHIYTEGEIILQRAGYFGKIAQKVEKMFECPRHRESLGKERGNPSGRTACRYPQAIRESRLM